MSAPALVASNQSRLSRCHIWNKRSSQWHVNIRTHQWNNTHRIITNYKVHPGSLFCLPALWIKSVCSLFFMVLFWCSGDGIRGVVRRNAASSLVIANGSADVAVLCFVVFSPSHSAAKMQTCLLAATCGMDFLNRMEHFTGGRKIYFWIGNELTAWYCQCNLLFPQELSGAGCSYSFISYDTN